MKFADHCKESIEKLGRPFGEVHEWLDAFAGTHEFGMKHRKKRHHLKGINDVKDMFGKEAAEAARLHIIADLNEEGWKESDHFPEDENDYVRMGLF
jgi:hypothetical protein